jgi:16S rRNA (adenine1518-N6/adenine1519-N6)-dimethyltransferase
MNVDINLLSPSEVKQILENHGLRPKKRLGQNFLIDRNILNKILDAAKLNSESIVLEIGPGLGTVTKEAAQIASKVIAVEADKDLIPILHKILDQYPNIEIVEGDFLRINLPKFLAQRLNGGRCTVVANLPYYITSPLITRLLEVKTLIERMVVMVQEEVAERLIAKPGTPDYGSLSVFVQFYCDVQIVARAKRTVFLPSPEVDSAIVRLEICSSPTVDVDDEQLFFKIVRASFGQRRKTLLRSLSGSTDLGWSKEKAHTTLEKAGIDPTRRGETLSLEEFASITRASVD